ncbi:MAG: hypothetical protein LBJ77_02590 [Holosporales bacterium]|nr:hypothetical protein [Holosporales bacterium]
MKLKSRHWIAIGLGILLQLEAEAAANRGHQIPPRSLFTREEDSTLKALVSAHGNSDWAMIATQMPNRNPRQCKERWRIIKDPENSEDIKYGWTTEEDATINRLHAQFGAKWTQISLALNRRNPPACQQRWNKLNRQQAPTAPIPPPPSAAPATPLSPEEFPLPQIHQRSPTRPFLFIGEKPYHPIQSSNPNPTSETLSGNLQMLEPEPLFPHNSPREEKPF